jgi:hypothetical protein
MDSSVAITKLDLERAKGHSDPKSIFRLEIELFQSIFKTFFNNKFSVSKMNHTCISFSEALIIASTNT